MVETVRSVASDSSTPARSRAGGRRRGRKAGRRPVASEERRGWIATGQPIRESVPERWWAQSPPAKPHQEDVAETWVSAERGASETSRAPTRGETSPLQKTERPPSQAFKNLFPFAVECLTQGNQDRQRWEIASRFQTLVITAADADLFGNLLLGSIRSGTQARNVSAKLPDLRGAGFGGHGKP